MPPKISPQSYVHSSCQGHILFNLNFPFKLILRRLRLLSDVQSENATLFERLVEIHSNPPILYYGLNRHINMHIKVHQLITTTRSYEHKVKPMVILSFFFGGGGVASPKCQQFSQNMDGFKQHNSQDFQNPYNSIKKPHQRFFFSFSPFTQTIHWL